MSSCAPLYNVTLVAIGSSRFHRFLRQLEVVLRHFNDSNKDILHMIQEKSGRNRTTLKSSAGSNKFSIQMTSITSPHAQQFTGDSLAKVDHVFYVVPLCSYCKTLTGGAYQNQMEGYIELFSLMSELNVMRTTPITIFFTQGDIFPQRIIDVPVNGNFPDHGHGTDASAAFRYFASKFRKSYSRQHTQLHLFAPGLHGSVSLQDFLDEVQGLIMRNINGKQQRERDARTVIGLSDGGARLHSTR